MRLFALVRSTPRLREPFAPRRRPPAAGLVVALWLATVAAVSAGGEAPADRALQARLDVATRAEPYLLLDLANPRLRLMNGGAVLRDYRVSAIELGSSTVMFMRRAARLPPRGVVWELERLDPARTVGRPVIVPPAPGRDAPPVAIPLEPEKALPAPASYRLHFDSGLSIQVVQAEPERPDRWWALFRMARWRLGELGQSISPRPEIRLRLVLPAPDAGALYRSLPVPVRLTVS